jgi:hypothetical protein
MRAGPCGIDTSVYVGSAGKPMPEVCAPRARRGSDKHVKMGPG